MPPKSKKAAPASGNAKKAISKRADAKAQAAAWRAAAVATGATPQFAGATVTAAGKFWPLKPAQRQELVSWIGGAWDKDWLRVKGGVPIGFVSQSGEVDPISLPAVGTAAKVPPPKMKKQKTLNLATAGVKATAGAVAVGAKAAAGGGGGGGAAVQPPLAMMAKGGKVLAKGCLLAAKMCDHEADFVLGTLRYDQFAATEKHDGHRGFWHAGSMYTRHTVHPSRSDAGRRVAFTVDQVGPHPRAGADIEAPGPAGEPHLL